MKRIFNLLMMAFVLMMTGCSVSNTPEDVAVKFMEALHSCDFKEAMNYCSEGSKGAMEKQIAFFEEKSVGLTYRRIFIILHFC